MLYLSIWHPAQGNRRVNLGHRDKARALRQAKELLELRDPSPTSGRVFPLPTLSVLFDRYTQQARYHPDGSLKTETYF
jgi:hypothetical protein